MNPSNSDDLDDPFREARAQCPFLAAEIQGETIPMILRHKDVRRAAKDWKTYSSDAPLRVPIPSEEGVRTVRQYPLEVDPPSHTAYRKLVEPFFLRPRKEEVLAKIHALIDRMLDRALAEEQFDIVGDFAIPLQSHALTYLLDVDENEAELWISWGIHVFKDGDGESKGPFMEDYCRQMFEAAEKNPGDDFFSALNQAEIDGRELTMEEKLGFANIAFAGGRDTIIHTVSRILHYFSEHPEDIARIREDPKLVPSAAEEFFRLFIPLTHIGRVCPVQTDVLGHPVEKDGRVSLAWSSANRDPAVFEDPNTVKLDRKPNPHVAFGFGVHNCLGQHHARAIMRGLIEKVSEKIERIEIVEKTELIEKEKDFSRMVGYEKLVANFTAR